MITGPVRVIALALTIVVLVGGGSLALSRYRISEDIEKGKGLAAQRNEERDRQQSSASRQTRMMDLLRTLEDSLASRPLDSMMVISAANIAYDLGEFDKSARYYHRFLDSIDPSNTPIRIDYAYSLYQTGKQAEGRSTLEDIIRKEPRNQTAMLNLAVMWAQDRQFDEALKWFKRCRSVDPESELGKRAAMAIEQLETKT
ncbi:MAG: tetratricopeptide repeat protein [Candidatus Kapabacteria bacterium]|nr:tetratricopeptide repeat protein [Candidatus Kapabacteria bacterium]